MWDPLRPQADLHAAVDQLLLHIAAELFTKFGQHNLARVNKDGSRLLRRELRIIVVERIVNEVVYGADGPDTGEAAAPLIGVFPP
jgi:hypothetical protein